SSIFSSSNLRSRDSISDNLFYAKETSCSNSFTLDWRTCISSFILD
ncbi:2395_t:CDS:1, partial [Funneliformis caledonium]